MKILSLSRLISFLMVGSLLALTACAVQPVTQQTPTTAPATPAQTTTVNSQKITVPNYHVVKSGESLSRIALKYNLDYIDIAKANKIPAPYNKISVGQRLKLAGLKQITSGNTQVKSQYHKESGMTWLRPVSSHHRKLFQGHFHTVYYKGKVGDSVYASADGYVVYADVTTSSHKQHKTLTEKGNTIIITHAHGYNSAYTHLSRILIPAGSYVKAGERIAEMGKTGNVDEPLLGFQIKQNGKFINPRKLIP